MVNSIGKELLIILNLKVKIILNHCIRKTINYSVQIIYSRETTLIVKFEFE